MAKRPNSRPRDDIFSLWRQLHRFFQVRKGRRQWNSDLNGWVLIGRHLAAWET